MKKIITILAAAVAAFSFASCEKSQTTEQTTKDIKFNITVANLDGSVDTKAVKSGWDAGDRLNLWFGEQNSNFEEPQAVLVYDGSKWEAQSVNDYRITKEIEKGHNTFSVFYESGNDMSKYSLDAYQIKSGVEMGDRINRLALVCRNIPFELAGDVLSANITGWKFATAVQITVTDVPAEFTVENTEMIDFTNNPGWLLTLLSVENYDGRMKLNADSGNVKATQGSEANSLVFYFKNTEVLPNNAEIILGLTTDGGETSKRFTKTFPEGMAAITEDSFKAISIPFSKFK